MQNIDIEMISKKASQATSPLDRPMTQTSPLLQLPSELRNRIYELVLVKDEPIKLPVGRSESDKRGLLGTCRQIHNEAAGIYYSNNGFIADCGMWFLNTDLISWLRGLGSKKRLILNDVRLSLRQQRVFSPPCELKDTHFFIIALMRRLGAMGLMLPEHVVKIEVGKVPPFEYLTISELDTRLEESSKKAVR